MLFSSRRTRVVQGIRVLIGISLLTIMLSSQAQDLPTAEPAPDVTATAVDLPSEPVPADDPIPVLPTEPVIIPTQEIIPVPIDPTSLPTQEILPVPTQEIMPVPTQDVTAVPTIEVTDETAAPVVPEDTGLPLAFSVSFDDVIPPELSPLTGWLEIAVDGGKGLQADVGAVPVNYMAALFNDAAVEARFLVNEGEGQVLLRDYTAGLRADGTVTLYRNQIAMASTVSPVSQESPWSTLRLQIIGTNIQVSVNGVLVMNSDDAEILATGVAGFAANSGSAVRIDNFAVYGTGIPVVKPAATDLDAAGQRGPSHPTLGEPLVPPTGITLTTNTNHDVIITWNDTNTDEDRYEIQRYISLTEVSIVGYTAQHATSFTETAVGCGLTVWYRIRAYREGDSPSAWSNWQAVHTAPCNPAACVPGAAIQRVNVGSFATMQSSSIHIATGRSLSEDGRYILFSSANPLVGDPQVEIDAEGEIAANDSYVYDTQTCTTQKASLGDFTTSNAETTEGGYPSAIFYKEGALSVLFYSASSDLTDPSDIVDTDGFKDVFWRDVLASSTQLASRETGGTTSINAGDVFGINSTPDFHYTLMSMADPISGIDNNDAVDLVVYDRMSEILSIVTLNTADPAETANDASFGGEVLVDYVTHDVYVVFTSYADNLVASGANATCTNFMPGATQCAEVFVRNLTTNVTTRLSMTSANGLSNGSAILDDAVIYNGKLHVTFQSVASNLVANVGGGMNAYLRIVPLANLDEPTDNGSGTTVMYARASNAVAGVGPTGVYATGPSYGGKLSSDARWIAFSSAAANLVAGDTNGKTDVFVRDMATSMTQRVSPSTANTQNSFATDISADGKKVLFYSETSDLVAGDTANVCEIDFADSQPSIADTQFDYNENCSDLFVVNNPMWAILAPPTKLTASVNLSERIRLTWVGAPGADTYKYEISPDGVNWSWSEFVPSGALTTFDFGIVSCSSTMYFRMRSAAGDGRVSAPTVGVMGRSAICPAPIIVAPSPVSGDVLSNNEVEIEWDDTSFVAAYEVDLSRVATFATHVIGYPQTTGDYYHVFDGDPISGGEQPLPDGVYYWRVRASYPGLGLYTATRSFTIDTTPPAVPVFTAPANLAIVRLWRPTLTWTKVIGVTYEIEMSYTGGAVIFTQPVTTPYTPPPFEQGSYTVRLRAFDAAGNMSISTPLTYIVNPAVSPAPNAVIAPVAAAPDANVKFTWPAAPAPLTAPAYTVQVDDNPLFDSLNGSCTAAAVAAPTCTISLPPALYYWRVLRVGEAGLIAMSPPPSNMFTVGAVAPRAPRLVSPANGKFLTPTERHTNDGDPLNTSILLDWDWLVTPTLPTPTGIIGYEVEISRSSLFDIESMSFNNLSADLEVITNTWDDGLYYWRVRAINNSNVVGAWSPGFSFVMDNLPPASAPTVLTPTVGAIVPTARPTFTWSPVPGAYRYEVKVVDTADCLTGINQHTSNTTILTTSYTIPAMSAALTQGTQHVCVKAFDRSDNETLFSTPSAFSVFLGTGPLNGAFVPAATIPTFTWAATPGTTNFTLIYDTDTDFTSGAVSLPVTGVSKKLSAVLAPDTYYWRVVRSGETVIGNPYRTFYVGALGTAPAPGVNPTLIKDPTNLTWLAAAPPTGATISHYEVVLSKAATFAPLFGTPEIILATDPLQITFTPDPNQNRVTYYWRVRGLDNGLPVTHWRVGSFIVDNVLPNSPTITAPVPNAIASTVRPTFSWLAVPGAVNYRIDMVDLSASTGGPIDLDPLSATNLHVVVNAPALSYIPVVNLPQSTVRVDITTFDGINNSAVASSLTFVVRLGTAPAHNGVVAVNKPTFTWTAVTGATSYELQIDDDPTFEQIAPAGDGGVLRTIPNIPAATHILQTALTPGVYYWRVKPSNGTYPDNYGSKMFAFTTTASAGNLVSLRGAVVDDNFNANEDNPITLDWTAPVLPAPLTPESYTVQISLTPNFLAIINPQTTNLTSVDVAEGSLNDGLYYWRVKTSYSADGSNFVYSAVKQFTLDTQAPPPPMSTVGSLPSDPVYTMNTLRPTFTWGLSATATKYHVTLYEVSGVDPAFSYTPIARFTDKIVLRPAVGAVASYTIPTTVQSLDQGVLYAWGVESEDLAGNISESFIERHFTVFVGKTPTDVQFVADTTPAFTWTALTGVGAGTWKLQIGYDSTMSPIAYETTVPLASTVVSHTVPNTAALIPGLYYWRVIRTSGADDLVVGRPFYVVTSLASVTPAPLLPLTNDIFNADEVDYGIDFFWTDLWQISGPQITDYEVEIRQTLPTNPIYDTVFSCGCNPTTYWQPLVTPPDGLYYWRVRAIFDLNYAGPFGAWRTFRIDTTLPGAPALSLPVDAAVFTTTRTPTFKWAAATGTPTRYVLEVSNTSDFTSIHYTTTVLAPALTYALPPAYALPNGTYYWRVTARDEAGNPVDLPDTGTLSTSLERRFTIAVP